MNQKEDGSRTDPVGDYRGLGQKLRFDTTVNLPTVLSVAAMAFALSVGAVRLYADVDARTTRNSYDLMIMQRQMDDLANDQQRIRTEMGVSLSSLRSDLRSDLRDLSLKVDTLLRASARE